LKGLPKDVASYLIAAQVGILGIVSVAIGMVNLITQRDDRSSTDTDVRLYYVESLACEVVLSGAALLIILCVQLLWPAQFIAHLARLGGRDLVFKVVLTALHLVWLLLNLAVFAQFLLTTLHFVEPSARERLRERYTANVIVPSDLWQRLLRLFYATAPKELVPVADGESRIIVGFGHQMLTEGNVDLRTKFAEPSVRHDVWLRPLGFVLYSWWRQARAGFWLFTARLLTDWARGAPRPRSPSDALAPDTQRWVCALVTLRTLWRCGLSACSLRNLAPCRASDHILI
jgi:hypothetical protein